MSFKYNFKRVSSIQELPQEGSTKIKPTKTSKKKDSVEVSTVPEKIEKLKPLDEPQKLQKGKQSLPEVVQEGSKVSIEDQLESLEELSLEDSGKKEKMEPKIKANKATIETAQTSEETTGPSNTTIDSKDQHSVQLEPLSAKSVNSKVAYEKSTELKPKVSDSQQPETVIYFFKHFNFFHN